MLMVLGSLILTSAEAVVCPAQGKSSQVVSSRYRNICCLLGKGPACAVEQLKSASNVKWPVQAHCPMLNFQAWERGGIGYGMLCCRQLNPSWAWPSPSRPPIIPSPCPFPPTGPSSESLLVLSGVLFGSSSNRAVQAFLLALLTVRVSQCSLWHFCNTLGRCSSAVPAVGESQRLHHHFTMCWLHSYKYLL